MSEDDHDPLRGDVDALIDQNLKLMYQELLKESLPDRFQDLLAVIRAEDQLNAKKDGDA
ncbi:MAG: NepR family anti-sigma factor [Yoonia sp.]|uniref:NepR family anti-sigma factor n=1 Tax=Rhodobacterales TaxID=204455 RepID=UPI0022008C53|nr:NepR family anti-sigma factor [Loktanella sp. F6476L]UWQ99241.1 hypothetical protein K3729_00085 [Rhodobacteraceae bacterium S2214]